MILSALAIEMWPTLYSFVLARLEATLSILLVWIPEEYPEGILFRFLNSIQREYYLDSWGVFRRIATFYSDLVVYPLLPVVLEELDERGGP
uniref:YggT family protein n=1 Tax=Ascaris lumbricoides TaxID=6252 RepID=A0A0M3I8C6_ASCLU